MNELLTMSAVDIAKKIKNREISPVEVMEVHLARMEEVNPKINAVVVPRFDEARKEAKEAEKLLAKTKKPKLPPFFGVPCTIKDTYAMAGLPWAGGLWKRRGLIPDFDATVVERVRQAGAIIMGKTNVPEAAMWVESYNHVYGRTKNPYDLSRGVGGSSGGEGAIIASGASPFGIGSDVGGSIRYPAAFNGIPAHKPTGGRVSGYGHWPEAKGPIARYNTYGPMARRVADLAPLLKLLQGPDGKDPIVEDHGFISPAKVRKKDLKVFYFESNGMARVNADVRRAVDMCAGALHAQGLPVEYWRPRGIKRSLEIWQAGMSRNPHPFVNILGDGEAVSLMEETVNFLLRRGKITLPALAVALIERPGQLLSGRNRKLLALADDLRQRIEERLGDNGVLICPVFSTPAPRHGFVWADLLGIGYSGLINIMGFPSTVMPVYYNKKGLPVSVQIVAGRWNDHVSLCVAAIVEKIFGGWKPPEHVG
ncbi:MAG: amidase [Deltaproteobacteria bacterium]|nr:MAG: amidase [Deltaproteobacteria bacterium]